MAVQNPANTYHPDKWGVSTTSLRQSPVEIRLDRQVTDRHPLSDKRKAEIKRQLERYLATDGEEGYWVGESEHLILTTIGRRSGEPRRTPLIFGTDGDRYLIVASLGGYDIAPHWYKNLVATAEVTVQVKADRFQAIATTATPSERPRLWAHMVELYPRYADYQANTMREIPVVVLERISTR